MPEETVTGSARLDTTGLQTIISTLSADWSGKAASRNFTPPRDVMIAIGLNQAKIDARSPGQWSSIESQIGVAYSNSDHLPFYSRPGYLIQEFTRLFNWGFQLMNEWDQYGVPINYGVVNTTPVTGTGTTVPPATGGGDALSPEKDSGWLKWILLAAALVA
jgi:hypothetical protein